MKYPPTWITTNNDTKTCHHKISEYQKLEKKIVRASRGKNRSYTKKTGTRLSYTKKWEPKRHWTKP